MFYIFHGNDSHTQRETLENLKNKLGDADMLALNTTQLEGKGLSVGQLQDACNAMPFLAPKRLVIVQDYFAVKHSKEEMNQLIDYLGRIPDSTRLVFLEKKALSARNRAIKLAQSDKKIGYTKQFDRPSGTQLNRWIMDRAETLGGRIHPKAANMLAINVGNDLSLLDQELEKLVLYKGISDNPEQITDRDVQILSPYAAEANIFDLVDALGNRNGRRAAELLQKKLDEGAEPFLIFSMFVRQFRLLLQVKELASDGASAPAIAQELKIHKFVSSKLFQQAQSFNLEQLENIFGHLLEIDINVKTGKTDMVTALNLLVFSLAI